MDSGGTVVSTSIASAAAAARPVSADRVRSGCFTHGLCCFARTSFFSSEWALIISSFGLCFSGPFAQSVLTCDKVAHHCPPDALSWSAQQVTIVRGSNLILCGCFI